MARRQTGDPPKRRGPAADRPPECHRDSDCETVPSSGNSRRAPIRQALADAVDRELDGDRRFFASHPSRAHRVRRAYPAEAAEIEQIGGHLFPPRTYVAVRQFAPGMRLRLFFVAGADLPADMPEPAAERLFQEAADRGNGRRHVAMMEQAAAMREAQHGAH